MRLNEKGVSYNGDIVGGFATERNSGIINVICFLKKLASPLLPNSTLPHNMKDLECQLPRPKSEMILGRGLNREI